MAEEGPAKKQKAERKAEAAPPLPDGEIRVSTGGKVK
jgi:hypothetical protein